MSDGEQTRITQGPWEAFDHAGATMQSYSQSSGVHGTGKHIGTLVCGCFYDINGGKEAASANAEFIARACNSHDELLAALKDAKREIEYLCEQSTLRFGIVKTRQAYLNIGAAIAKAEVTRCL